jgi:hypothetical protein
MCPSQCNPTPLFVRNSGEPVSVITVKSFGLGLDNTVIMNLPREDPTPVIAGLDDSKARDSVTMMRDKYHSEFSADCNLFFDVQPQKHFAAGVASIFFAADK